MICFYKHPLTLLLAVRAGRAVDPADDHEEYILEVTTALKAVVYW